jgi:phage shock protein PspC (stress-responsive transcriptional regulator)
MNKVITINLDGAAYQLEEGGYETLRAYLETAATRLQGNPDRDEILSDIERAIADKFRTLLTSHKTVVVEKEVTAVLAEMGPIEADSGESAKADASSAGTPGSAGGQGPFHSNIFGSVFGHAGAQGSAGPGPRPRRLYKIKDGAIFDGVCNGLGAYINTDPTLIRLAFVLSVIFFGCGIMVYVVLMFVMPEARTPEEKAAASTPPQTTQDFIRRAKEGYYEAVKGFPDRKAQRAWRRRFRREMRANAYAWRRGWTGCAPIQPGMSFALPVLSFVHGVVLLTWICAMISLLSGGDLFGLALPAGLPVWLGAVLLIVAYGILVAPLKAARHACYSGACRSTWSWPFMHLLEALVGLAVFVIILYLTIHYFPEIREAIRSLPTLAHQAAHDIKSWWKGS